MEGQASPLSTGFIPYDLYPGGSESVEPAPWTPVEVPPGYVVVDEGCDGEGWFEDDVIGYVVPPEVWAEYQRLIAAAEEIAEQMRACPRKSPRPSGRRPRGIYPELVPFRNFLTR